MLGFFSFTEVTDPTAHRAYDEWHRLDHMPEQFSLDGLLFGRRWVCTPACRQARVAVSARLEPCHYMTLYLMRDTGVLAPFADLARRLRREGRFFEARQAHLAGPFEVTGQWVAPRVRIGATVVPFRPDRGIYVVVGPPVDGATMVADEGVAGAWAFVDLEHEADQTVTVAFIDGDLAAAAHRLGRWCLESGPGLEWAGPLAPLDTDAADWFDRLTPQ